MLFASVGQGAIFLLLLCVGCVVAVAEIALVAGLRRVKCHLFSPQNKIIKNDKKSQKNSEKYTKIQENTQIDKKRQKIIINNNKSQKFAEKDKNSQIITKKEENQQKITKNNTKMQTVAPANSNRTIVIGVNTPQKRTKNIKKYTKNHIKSQKRTKINKNSQKNTTANAVVERLIKANLLDNVWQFLLGFARVAVYAMAICVFVWRYDFGNLRAYHILAFLVGFGAIKTIFAYRPNLVPQNDKI